MIRRRDTRADADTVIRRRDARLHERGQTRELRLRIVLLRHLRIPRNLRGDTDLEEGSAREVHACGHCQTRPVSPPSITGGLPVMPLHTNHIVIDSIFTVGITAVIDLLHPRAQRQPIKPGPRGGCWLPLPSLLPVLLVIRRALLRRDRLLPTFRRDRLLPAFRRARLRFEVAVCMQKHKQEHNNNVRSAQIRMKSECTH